MSIAIYKPFKKIYFHDLSDDYAAWSSEVTKLATILADRGEEVYIISDTDLKPDFHERIHSGDVQENYDRVILFCGSFKLDEKGDDIIEELRPRTSRLDFIITDLSLLPDDPEKLDYFDNIYSQATTPMELTSHRDQYGGLIEITAFGHEYDRTPEEAIKQKTLKYTFGGSERNRLHDFVEYVYRPDCVFYAKSDRLKFNTRVSRTDYLQAMYDSIASICIADTHYNANHFITHRPIECFLTDTVCFTDSKYDPDGAIIPLDSWLRVSNFIELFDKIEELKNNEEKWVEILNWQRSQIESLIDGEYVYNKLR